MWVDAFIREVGREVHDGLIFQRERSDKDDHDVLKISRSHEDTMHARTPTAQSATKLAPPLLCRRSRRR